MYSVHSTYYTFAHAFVSTYFYNGYGMNLNIHLIIHFKSILVDFKFMHWLENDSHVEREGEKTKNSLIE